MIMQQWYAAPTTGTTKSNLRLLYTAVLDLFRSFLVSSARQVTLSNFNTRVRQ